MDIEIGMDIGSEATRRYGIGIAIGLVVAFLWVTYAPLGSSWIRVDDNGAYASTRQPGDPGTWINLSGTQGYAATWSLTGPGEMTLYPPVGSPIEGPTIAIDAPLPDPAEYRVEILGTAQAQLTLSFQLTYLGHPVPVREAQIVFDAADGSVTVSRFALELPVNVLWYTVPETTGAPDNPDPGDPIPPDPDPDPDPRGSGSVVAYLASMTRSGGYGPAQNPDYTALFWDSYGARAMRIAGGTNPAGIADKMRNAVNTNSPIDDVYWATTGLVGIGAQPPTGLATAIQLRNNPATSNGYDMGLAWEYYRAHSLVLMGQAPNNAGSLESALIASQAPSGAWEDVPMGQAMSSLDGFRAQEPAAWRTHHAVSMLLDMDRAIPNQAGLASWIVSSQNSDGGWGHQAGWESDLYPTWCMVRVLYLTAQPIPNQGALQGFVLSCQNSDGGFGDRPSPGWESRIETTFYAVDILNMAGANTNPSQGAGPAAPAWYGDSSYRVYYAMFEAWAGNYPGSLDSPGEAAIAAAKMGLTITGAKYASSTTSQRYNDYASLYGLETFCAPSPENYGFKMHINGYHWADHAGESAGFETSSFPYAKGTSMGISYPDFANRNSAKTGSLRWFSQDWKQEHWARDAYEYAYHHGAGYNALMGMGIYSEDHVALTATRENGATGPFESEKWLGHYPVITSLDNHGTWAYPGGFPKAEAGVTAYLAKDPSWASFIDACQAGRVVTATADGLLWGNRYACDMIRARGFSTPRRPGIVVLPITSANSYEWSRYPWEVWQSGAVIRIVATDQNGRIEPSRVLSISVDGSARSLSWKTRDELGAASGKPAKYLHGYGYVELPGLSPGSHSVSVQYRELDGSTRTEVTSIVVA